MGSLSTRQFTLSQMTILLNGLERYPELRLLSELSAIRKLLLTDLYALVWWGLGRQDIENEWLFQRCREIENAPDGFLDLWAREHYKSTIITLGKTIQDILRDPEITVGIFSHTRPIAKGFLRQIKREFEANARLKLIFPDILWQDPAKESPSWSEDSGIIVKRQGNPKESTVEAYGLVDGQPTSKHYQLMVYDDVVTKESVSTPEMIHKTTEAWELSRSLGTEGGRERYIGTRYAFSDSYRVILDRKAAIPRIHPATLNGQVDGEPVLLSKERLMKLRNDQGPFTFGCQQLLDPTADKAQGFLAEWIKFYKDVGDARDMTRYILVDAASEKKRNSDYTAMVVWGLAQDGNYYFLDAVRDRLKLTERADALFSLHRRWKPEKVGYERYGMMSDIEHLKDRQERENYHFPIVEMGGPMPKTDRIKRLIPIFEEGRVFLPQSLTKVDYEGIRRDLIGIFIEEEYKAFPVGLHDDMLDAMARLLETNDEWILTWPLYTEDEEDRYASRGRRSARAARSWLTA